MSANRGPALASDGANSTQATRFWFTSSGNGSPGQTNIGVITANISLSNSASTAAVCCASSAAGRQPPDPGCRERRLEILQETPILILDHLMHPTTDRAELLVGRHTRRVPFARIAVRQHLQAAHTDHEELVQVRRR